MLGRALAGWLASTQPDAERMALWAHVRVVASCMLLSEVLAAWAEEYVPACIAAREAACRAAVHWRAATLRGCLRSWRTAAEARAVQREALLRSMAFHHRRTKRQGLAAWRGWAEAKVRVNLPMDGAIAVPLKFAVYTPS